MSQLPDPTRAPVVVALSGGVDSATAAALLIEAGERVIGVSMRLYDAKNTAASSGGRCCGPRDLEDARQVASHLGIPFYVANYEDTFRDAVIDQFVAEYAAGRTPNPCVQCNSKVKFLPLLRRAREALALAADCSADDPSAWRYRARGVRNAGRSRANQQAEARDRRLEAGFDQTADRRILRVFSPKSLAFGASRGRIARDL